MSDFFIIVLIIGAIWLVIKWYNTTNRNKEEFPIIKGLIEGKESYHYSKEDYEDEKYEQLESKISDALNEYKDVKKRIEVPPGSKYSTLRQEKWYNYIDVRHREWERIDNERKVDIEYRLNNEQECNCSYNKSRPKKYHFQKLGELPNYELLSQWVSFRDEPRYVNTISSMFSRKNATKTEYYYGLKFNELIGLYLCIDCMDLIEITNASYSNPKLTSTNLYTQRRKKVDKAFVMQLTMRSNLRRTYQQIDIDKSSSNVSVLGFSAIELRNHIENNFLEGMSWDNREEWHIDHIIPLSLAKTEEQGLLLNQLANLRPIWKKDNLSKSDSIKNLDNEFIDGTREVLKDFIKLADPNDHRTFRLKMYIQ